MVGTVLDCISCLLFSFLILLKLHCYDGVGIGSTQIARMVTGQTFWAQSSLFMTANLPTVGHLFLQVVLANELGLSKLLLECLLGATMLHILLMNSMS